MKGTNEKPYYAVKRGRKPGIYFTSQEFDEQTKGYKGSEGKKFSSLEQAYKYLGKKKQKRTKSRQIDNSLIAYVDGSFNERTKECSYGLVIIEYGGIRRFSEKFNNPDLVRFCNTGAEIKAIEAAIRYAINNGYEKVSIYYDCSSASSILRKGSKHKKLDESASFFKTAKERIDIKLIKVKAHSNNYYNMMAHRLSRKDFIGISNHEIENRLKRQVYMRKNFILNKNIRDSKILLAVNAVQIFFYTICLIVATFLMLIKNPSEKPMSS